MRVWFTLCYSPIGYMQRLHSISWHPETSSCSCHGPQPSPILQAWPLGPFTALLISAWLPGLVIEQEGLFCRSLTCCSFPIQPASGLLAACRCEQVSPSPTILCSPILSTLDLGQPPHQHHCKGLCESHGEGAENTSESVSHFPQPHSTWQSRSKDPGRGRSLPSPSLGHSLAAKLAPQHLPPPSLQAPGQCARSDR